MVGGWGAIELSADAIQLRDARVELGKLIRIVFPDLDGMSQDLDQRTIGLVVIDQVIQ